MRVLPFSLLILVLLIPVAHTANPGLVHGPFFRGIDLEFHISETSKAQSAATFAEAIFNLPHGHLSPVYEQTQHQALVDHIRSPNSRFVVLRTYRNQFTFVVSPWLVRRHGEVLWSRTMLLLQVWHVGMVTPLGYAVVKDGVPHGHRKEFWETLQRAARTPQPELMDRFGIRSIVTPFLH